MAYAQLHHGSHPTRISGQFSGMANRLWNAYRGWRARRQMLRTLYSLDRATLKDLGISPYEVESLVYGNGRDHARPYDENWWQRG